MAEEPSRSPQAGAMRVTVVYAQPERAFEYDVDLAAGATAGDAIAACALHDDVPNVDLSAGIGIFGKPCKLTTRLRGGDRVEIYRELTIDPREARRLRAMSESS